MFNSDEAGDGAAVCDAIAMSEEPNDDNQKKQQFQGDYCTPKNCFTCWMLESFGLMR